MVAPTSYLTAERSKIQWKVGEAVIFSTGGTACGGAREGDDKKRGSPEPLRSKCESGSWKFLLSSDLRTGVPGGLMWKFWPMLSGCTHM